MNIKLILTGATAEHYLSEGMNKYLDRLKHYCKLECIEIRAPKAGPKKSEEAALEKEAELLLKRIGQGDYMVLLDEKGQQFTSVAFSQHLQKRMNSGVKNLVFVAGGAHGFSESLYQRADEKLSLSKMTFTHEMVRLFFLEQLYRAFTILKGEKYHHE